MVAEQRETVQRIDADTQDIADNVSGAQRELLKYYASISSNRWLMLKIFGVLIVFVSFISSHKQYLLANLNISSLFSSSSHDTLRIGCSPIFTRYMLPDFGYILYCSLSSRYLCILPQALQ